MGKEYINGKRRKSMKENGKMVLLME